MDGGGSINLNLPQSPFQKELKIVRRTNTIVQYRTIQKIKRTLAIITSIMEQIKSLDPYTSKLIVKIFNSYEESRELKESDKSGITLFHCKCALIELLGEEISTKSLSKLLMECCKWNYHQYYVSLDEFAQLYLVIITHPSFADLKQKANQQLYSRFDTVDKGWIKNEEFSEVMSGSYPAFAKGFGRDLFEKMLDPNNSGRVRK